MLDRKLTMVPTSKVSTSRAARLQRMWCDVVSSIYRDAETYHLSHSEVLARFTERVLEMPEWQRVPGYVQAYVLGYKNALADAVWRKVVWMKSIDGQLLTTEEIDALSSSEQYSDPTYRSPWQRCDAELSCFVWIGPDGQPLRDRRWT